jgi:PAS domain S-box-containing protein
MAKSCAHRAQVNPHSDLSVGFAIFDQELKLIGISESFVDIHHYPASLCRTGADFAKLYRFDIEQGDCAVGDVEEEVESRLELIRKLMPHSTTQELGNGQVLRNIVYPISAGDTLLISIDVTASKRMEAALKESESRYTLIEQAITEGIYEWLIEESTLNASARMKQIFGLIGGKEAFTNWNWNERVHPEDFERYKDALREHFKGHTDSYECEYRVRDQSGQYRWLLDRGVCIRDVKGRAIRMIGSITDLTEHMKRETELVEKTTILESILENMDQGISMVDKDLNVIAFNQKFLALLEFPPDKFQLGYHMSEAFRYNAERGEYGPGDVDQLVEERLELARKFESHHFERIRPDGTVIEIHGVPLPDKGGMVTTYTDVTNLRRAERELANKEAQLRVALDNMPGGMTLVDSDQNYVLFNQQYVDMHDFPDGLIKIGANVRDEVEFQSLRGDFGKGGMLDLVEPALDIYRGTEAQSWERTILEGRTLQFLTAPTPDGGNATIVTNITERKRAEEKLKQQNIRLREEIDAHGRSKATIEYLVDEIKSRHNFEEIIGKSDLLEHVLAQLEQVAETDSTVLIQGETGTGKELFVRAIHNLSNRKTQPLVKVNCAALPHELVESELFGHERGAFTGATEQRKGRFELADKGTIFLDEVGELPPEAQAKLLRVLQEHEFERVGGTRTIHTDVRVIAATNRNLTAEVDAGKFRSDLFYRLSVFPLTVPPLRQRRSDIPLLVEHFLNRFSRKLGKQFDGIAPNFLSALMDYSWQGNIRELENVIERAVILSLGPLLEMQGPLDRPTPIIDENVAQQVPHTGTLEEVERAYINKVLIGTSWKIEGPNGAAKILGLNPSTLRGRMRKLNIKKSH